MRSSSNVSSSRLNAGSCKARWLLKQRHMKDLASSHKWCGHCHGHGARYHHAITRGDIFGPGRTRGEHGGCCCRGP
eukprot:14952469-Alexandrium_andersonii.AAC.1